MTGANLGANYLLQVCPLGIVQLTNLIEAHTLYAGLSGGAGVARDLGEKGEVNTENRC